MESYGRFATVYDRLMADMPYEQWVSFATEAWHRYGSGKPTTVVDLGCGTGNVTLPLAASGYQLTGIDLSETMLAIARDKYDSAAPSRGTVQWVCQDMREWAVPEPVDAVVSFCDCLNYVTEPDDVKKVFQATYNQLRAGGTFVFDVHHVRQFEQYAETQPFAYDEGDVSYIWFCDYDEELSQIQHELTLFVQDEASGMYERIDESHTQRAYDLEWLRTSLAEAGFTEVNVFADFKWASPDEQSHRLFIVAVKA
ncbi:class I SAM-dependent DNA methyltransferase [Paenibacillus sp. 481]|uniref:class I SAM-dependent DNA methyltransferase n=1 Tax=Paenibacillus sp. 481 TaxID=2835869 RepID=UPI001E63B64C|nr:class I SAM-dependent methyltransferase [Paenibacillus sp. 481]UHA75822.1 class I SAM-dependent methyltransferase [Paenibacillus sp. 481]